MSLAIKVPRSKLIAALRGYTVDIEGPSGTIQLESAYEPRWKPMAQREMTPSLMHAHTLIGMDPSNMEVWANGTYECFVKPMSEKEGRDGPVHLSIKRMDRMVIHDWRHLQQIKNEVLGEFREAAELYPGEHRVADSANQYHLWVAAAGEQLPFGFPSGYVTDDAEAAAFNANEEEKPLGHQGFQEPRQPGITVGEKMIEATDPEMKARANAALRSMR